MSCITLMFWLLNWKGFIVKSGFKSTIGQKAWLLHLYRIAKNMLNGIISIRSFLPFTLDIFLLETSKMCGVLCDYNFRLYLSCKVVHFFYAYKYLSNHGGYGTRGIAVWCSSIWYQNEWVVRTSNINFVSLLLIIQFLPFWLYVSGLTGESLENFSLLTHANIKFQIPLPDSNAHNLHLCLRDTGFQLTGKISLHHTTKFMIALIQWVCKRTSWGASMHTVDLISTSIFICHFIYSVR